MDVNKQLKEFTDHRSEIANHRLYSYIRSGDTSRVVDIWLNTLTTVVYDGFLLIAYILLDKNRKK